MATHCVPGQDDCAVNMPLGEPCSCRWQGFPRKLDWQKFESNEKKKKRKKNLIGKQI